MSRIEWTDKSLNCVTGCTPRSPGCKNCFAKSMTRRLQGMYNKKVADEEEPKGFAKYAKGFDEVCIHPTAWQVVKTWKPGTKVFLNPMSDTFLEDVPRWYVKSMFENMNHYKEITWQVLTKRSEYMEDLCNHRGLGLNFTPNIWMGVSVESQAFVFRIKDLAKIKAKVKFVSFEPLLGPIDLWDVADIKLRSMRGVEMVECEHEPRVEDILSLPFQWAVIGAETGRKPRPMEEQWVRDLIRQLKSAGVKIFYKQKMVDGKKVSCPEIDGRQWIEYPG